jgi:prepilin-type N-terminal cleavage/methylation domain-containing protein
MSSPLIPCRAGGQAGFTLLELLVVTAILGLIAYVALDTVAQDTSSVRFDDTRTRLVSIRNAVLGRPAMGQAPGATGFIADVGRVPDCPQELMTNFSCAGVTMTAWHLDIDTSTTPSVGTGLGYGWRGPYLHAFRETQCVSTVLTPCTATSTGEVALRDGWGNTASGEEFNDDGTQAGTFDLFGWRRFGQDTKGNFYVQSYGSDGAADTVATFNIPDLYANDYPPAATGAIGGLPDALVAARDYQIALPALSIQLTNATGSQITFDKPYVCASLHYVRDGAIATLFTNAGATALSGGLDNLVQKTIELTFPTSAPTWLPAGPLALRLRGADVAGATCDASAPLLKHSLNPDTSRCSADSTKPSPGLACGTSIITTVPPSLPPQINVSLTWP